SIGSPLDTGRRRLASVYAAAVSSQLLFRAHHDLKGVLLYTGSLPRAFSVRSRGGADVDVALVPTRSDESGHPANLTDVTCEATLRQGIGRRPSAGFAALAQGRLPDDANVDRKAYGGGRPYLLDDDGTVRGAAPYEVLPAHKTAV